MENFMVIIVSNMSENDQAPCTKLWLIFIHIKLNEWNGRKVVAADSKPFINVQRKMNALSYA